MAWIDQRISANGLKLHVTHTGGDKPPLLLLHGFTDFSGNWRTFARLVEDRFDVIMPDFRSHGHSDRAPGYDADALSDDALGVLDALGIAQATVLGHSMGAVTTLRLAARFPARVAAILLEDPVFLAVHKAQPYAMSAWEQNVRRWQMLDPDALRATARAENPKWTHEEADLWGDAKPLFDIEGFKSKIFLHWPDWRDDCRSVGTRNIPGLLLLGDTAKGAIVSPQIAQEAQALWPQLQTVTLAGTGHNIRRDDLSAYTAAVRGYLGITA
jgi:N-formylmaleamate deformylase